MKLSDLLVNLRQDLDATQQIKARNGIELKYKIDKIIVEILTENFKSVNGGLGLNIAKIEGATGNKNHHKIIIEMSPKGN